MRIAVVGGAGRVGLPLSVLLAQAGHHVDAVDIDAQRLEMLRAGNAPFREEGLDEILGSAISSGRLVPTSDDGVYALADAVIVVVGTDLDMNGKPQNDSVLAVINRLRDRIRPRTLVILRSTIMPGTTAVAKASLRSITERVVYCPERIVEGQAVLELGKIPQLVGCDAGDLTYDDVAGLFEGLGVECVRVSPEVAEMGKLILNSWRYAQFALANEFARFCFANDTNYSEVLAAISYKYPRATGLKSAGLAGGPCLEKDTRQLVASVASGSELLNQVLTSHDNSIDWLISRAEQVADLSKSTVALLGLTFKPGSDDLRGSASVGLAKKLQRRAKKLLVVDPHVVHNNEFTMSSLDEALRAADVVVVGTLHEEFLDVHPAVPFVKAVGC